MNRKSQKFRFVEKKFLGLYSAWQETHRSELALGCMTLLAELVKLNPHYSVRRPFEGAF